MRRAGASDRLAVVKLPQYRVSSFLESTEDAKAMLVKTAREAIEQDGAEVIILAGGMRIRRVSFRGNKSTGA